MLSTFPRDSWGALGPTSLSDALEQPTIVFFPESPISLPSEDDLALLRDELPRRLKRKNVSWYPTAKRLAGVDGDRALAERVQRILDARSQQVQAYLTKVMPGLTRGWTVGTTSFRPMEERGRNLSAHASNELIHVDAGAYGATHGARILRFFTNVNTTDDRVWATKGDFASLYQRFGERAGIAHQGSLAEGPLDRVRTGLLRAAEACGVRRALMADGSPYDRRMRQFHNFMKDTPEFQADPQGHQEVRFPPGSSWMVFTDGVSHACLSGQHAFVDTFVIPLENCRHPANAPFHVLEERGAQVALST